MPRRRCCYVGSISIFFFLTHRTDEWSSGSGAAGVPVASGLRAHKREGEVVGRPSGGGGLTERRDETAEAAGC